MRMCAYGLSGVLAIAGIGCHDQNRYSPVGPDNPNGFTSPIATLEISPTTLAANGATRATVTATIDPRSTVKVLSFSTTRGVLSGQGDATSAQKTSINVTTDGTGVATLDLRAGSEPGPVVVTASIALTANGATQTFTRTANAVFTAVEPTQVIVLTTSPSTTDADGASRILLTANLSPEIAPAYQEVIFTASAGQFASHRDPTNAATPQAKVPISGGNAIVELTSPLEPQVVNVTAQVGTFRTFAQVSFSRAAPDTIFVQPAKSAVARLADTVTVTTLLFRDRGQVANNTVVTYEARDSAGTLVGTFSGPTLAVVDAEDTSTGAKRLKSTVTFDPDDTAALGAATITARAAGKSATTTLQIK